MSGILRTRYSSLFAWCGRLSLELFVTQYHVWLAADNHGVLVLLPGYPVLNVLITCYILICVTHEVRHVTDCVCVVLDTLLCETKSVMIPVLQLHEMTRTLSQLIVPNDWRVVMRNVGLFLMVLIPIGIHDGMF